MARKTKAPVRGKICAQGRTRLSALADVADSIMSIDPDEAEGDLFGQSDGHSNLGKALGLPRLAVEMIVNTCISEDDLSALADWTEANHLTPRDIANLRKGRAPRHDTDDPSYVVAVATTINAIVKLDKGIAGCSGDREWQHRLGRLLKLPRFIVTLAVQCRLDAADLGRAVCCAVSKFRKAA